MRTKKAPPQGYKGHWTSEPPQGVDTASLYDSFSPQGNELFPAFWVPFNDLGAGVVDTTEYRTNATPTFTRATTAWTRLSTGLWASVASGSPRSYYTEAGLYAGFIGETSRTNLALHARDLTNAAWAAVNVTPAKTQAGIDGVTNSCSLMTAGAIGGTLLQTVVSASATRTFSARIKRSVGTGTLEMCVDGVTFTDVTSQISSSAFTLVQVTQAAVTNPIIGFRIGSNGDAFIVDMCQLESASFASTPIPTTTASVVRNADVLTYATSPWFNDTEGSFSVQLTRVVTLASAAAFVEFDDTTANERIFVYQESNQSFRGGVVDGGVSQCTLTTPGTPSLDTPTRMSMCYKANDFIAYRAQSASSADTAGTLPTVTQIRFASTAGGTAFGAMSNFRYFNRRLSNSQLQALTA